MDMGNDASGRFGINGAWWIREDNIDAAAHRVEQTFNELAKLASNWRKWYLPHESIKFTGQPQRVLSNNRTLIREELRTRCTRTDVDHDDEDGYSMIATSEPENGTGLESCSLYVRCCSRTPYS